jgi:1L-myo-inositol 1-phosphate cytidylyltransferase / CDP-L-myo-inositol myo-inositolphosphotransferase
MTAHSTLAPVADLPVATYGTGGTGPTLVVVFPSNQGNQALVSPTTMVLGLPFLRRVVLTAQRAGYSTILVSTSDPSGITPILEGTLALAVAPSDMSAHIPPGKLVLLVSHVLPTQRLLKWLLDKPIQLDRAYLFGQVAALIEPSEAPANWSILQDVFQGRSSFLELARACPTSVEEEGDIEGLYPLTSIENLREAERHLLRGLIKKTEGFMSRHVERRISLAITQRLVSTRVTPNGMTLISVGIGLLGAPFFLSSEWILQLVGALLFLSHSILDGCDGELARLRFQESRWGGILDFWGDNVVHVAVFACMGIGWSLSLHETWPLWLGVLPVAGTIGSAWFVYHHTMRGAKGTGPLFTSVVQSPDSSLSQLMDSLARRDFIYLVAVLSAFGKASWFLVLSAIGTPIYFLILLWFAYTQQGERRKLL